jgi:hypothetical protein
VDDVGEVTVVGPPHAVARVVRWAKSNGYLSTADLPAPIKTAMAKARAQTVAGRIGRIVGDTWVPS